MGDHLVDGHWVLEVHQKTDVHMPPAAISRTRTKIGENGERKRTIISPMIITVNITTHQ